MGGLRERICQERKRRRNGLHETTASPALAVTHTLALIVCLLVVCECGIALTVNGATIDFVWQVSFTFLWYLLTPRQLCVKKVRTDTRAPCSKTAVADGRARHKAIGPLAGAGVSCVVVMGHCVEGWW